MMGLMEFFWLLFLLFPTQPYGKPAPAATVLRHVPPGAQLVITVDAASVVQGMNRGLDRVIKAKFVQQTPELKLFSDQIVQAREMMLTQAKTFGIDPFKDIRYVTISVGKLDAPEPDVLAVFGGKIEDKTLDQLAAQAGAKKDGKYWVSPEGDKWVVARAKDGAVLAGSKAWVDLALARKARAPAMKPLLSMYDKKTFLLLAFQPSKQMEDKWHTEVDWVARPLLTSMHGLGFRMGYKGFSLKVQTDKKKLSVWQDLFYGFGRWTVATRETSEGALFIAQGLLSSLEPVAKLSHDLSEQDARALEAMVKHRKEIRKLVSSLFVGPVPKPKVKTNKRNNTVSLMVGGGNASLALLPTVGALVGWLTMRRAAPDMPPPAAVEAMPEPTPTPKAPQPAPTP
jgi:hypothetical protein